MSLDNRQPLPVFRVLSVDDVEEGFLESHCDGSRSSFYLLAVDLADWGDFGGCAGEKCFVCSLQFGGFDAFFDDFVAEVASESHY